MPTENVVAALVHDQMGQVLSDVFRGEKNPIDIGNLAGSATLVGQLRATDSRPHLSPALGLSIVGQAVSGRLSPPPLAEGSDPLGAIRGVTGPGLFTGMSQMSQTALNGLLGVDNAARFVDVAQNFFAGVRDSLEGVASALGSVERVQQLIGHDVGPALSFATLMSAAKQGLQDIGSVPQKVEEGLLDYFFASDGYQTVDGAKVLAPVHLSDLEGAADGVAKLKQMFSKTTAEQYLRDITRVIVESFYDGLREMKARYDAALERAKDGLQGDAAENTERKFIAWFRGVSSVAESGAMRAVEIGAQGAAQFQTNPLLAAAAGAFAGTVARKLAQDAFLAAV